MDWAELISLIIIIALLYVILNIRRQNQLLQKQYFKLLKSSGELESIATGISEKLNEQSDVECIKELRETYGFSMVQAKQIVDKAKSEEVHKEE
ncbi:MAG TPA: hypothetical protein VK125_00780 [Bacillota bacterium]|nr:hypothetical protein [Bacillota bacterium]